MQWGCCYSIPVFVFLHTKIKAFTQTKTSRPPNLSQKTSQTPNRTCCAARSANKHAIAAEFPHHATSRAILPLSGRGASFIPRAVPMKASIASVMYLFLW